MTSAMQSSHQVHRHEYPNADPDVDGDIMMTHPTFNSDSDQASALAFGKKKSESAMDCDTALQRRVCDGVNESTSATSVSSEASSPASSTASIVDETEPELSQSFGSTRSLNLVTPIKHQNLASTQYTNAQFQATARWMSQASKSALTSSSPAAPSSTKAALSFSSPPGSPQASPSGGKQGQQSNQRLTFERQSIASSAKRPLNSSLPGLAGLLKLDISPRPDAIAPEGPVTPGGRAASGARDGAANASRPVSPFEPPTPLMSPKDCAVFGPQESLPASVAPIASTRPKMLHRHTALPARSTPLSKSNVVPPLRDDSEGTSRATTPSDTSTSVASTSSSLASTLLTPPISPYMPSKTLNADYENGTISERRGSTGSATSVSSTPGEFATGASKKRTEAGRSVSPRTKASKSAAPYSLPTREDGSANGSKAAANKSPRGYFAANSPMEGAVTPTNPLVKDSKPSVPISSGLASSAPRMEKSYSEPVARTVSARHLMGRNLNPRFTSEYYIGDELGSGGFGFVVSATRIADLRPVAVKFIWRNKVPSHGWVRDEEFGAIPMEAFVLRVVNSPFVVKYIDLLADKDFFYLIQELHGSPWKAPSGNDEGQMEQSSNSKQSNTQASLSLPNSSSNGKGKALKGALSPLNTKVASAKSVPQPAESLSGVSTVTAPSPTFAVFPPESDVPLPNVSILSSSPSTFSEAGSSEDNFSDCALSDASGPSIKSLRPAPLERRSSCDLFECIEQHSYFAEDRARWIFAQIVEAVYDLDQKGICHRDIKDENCVVDRDFNVKLIDFGSAVVVDPRRPPPYFNRFFGTMTFAPSEILQGKQYRAPNAEIWSLGVLMSILLTGECPFSDPRDAVRGRLSRPTDKFSTEALDLLRSCLVVDPDQRATILQVRNHPWVAKAWTQRPGGANGSRVDAAATAE